MASSSLPPPEPSGRPVVALAGPTASGKTAVAGVLRGRLGAEVVSADSAALYAGLPVLTAAPGYPARLVGTVPLDEEVSVGAYQRLAHEAIDELVAAGRKALVVGGTGLYLRAALAGLRLPPPPAAGERERWQTAYDDLGPDAAHALLGERDPGAAARVHPNDRRRVVRALELAAAGHTLAQDRLWSAGNRHETRVVVLDVPLTELDRRIAARVQAMADAGVVDEAKRAWAGTLSATARKVLGLAEFATLPLDEAVEAVTAATHRLARYQRKWLRRLDDVVTLDGRLAPEEIADAVVALERPGERLPRPRRRATDA